MIIFNEMLDYYLVVKGGEVIINWCISKMKLYLIESSNLLLKDRKFLC